MLQQRVNSIDTQMSKVEIELEKQEIDIKAMLEKRKIDTEEEINASESLLRNVKRAYRQQKDRLDSE